ncbi:lipopolysaccharide biosynthesis protein RfbH [Mesoterricola silvestris]|uniref:LPS biosynthesis protein n=1 Tax=Mesoterricola silvestris TaxID=2927979 RepID=A0AA48GSM9_9BACT|nr:lipopolysaccharide biosynthesis protein RfbH [Mesoterricola silvestris]BDU71011.1 LPS biosynthesis protein [Mesoterricola silvestris]
MSNPESLRAQILELTRQYAEIAHAPKPFVPGESRVHYSGRVFDQAELLNLVGSSLDFWLTAGPYATRFEEAMRGFFGSRGFLLVNSGSSANLLMVSALCAEAADKARESGPGRLLPGDEIITPAVTFPTTLTPILQNRLVPVFVDCEVDTCNIDPGLVEDAIGPRTRAILAPHTVGNPCDLAALTDIARRRNLWLLEDGCDALGATFEGRLVGTFGAMSSLSFYPAHHITMGEGGGVCVNAPELKRTLLSLRDWGRDCWCDPGANNTCGRRFDWHMGELPYGYDHKYIYSNLGYNLKATDLQAAIGLAQFDKIPRFVAARRRNFRLLLQGLKPLEDRLLLPRIDPRADPSPFGFPITVREGVDRRALVGHLEAAKIETRLVFGGNILRQPGFLNIDKRVAGSLEGSDRIMRDTFFVGVYPGLGEAQIEYILGVIHGFFARN